MNVSLCFGRAVVTPWALLPFLPLPGVTVGSHTSRLPGDVQYVKLLHQLDIAVAASNPLVTQAFISLYGFNFGKYRAAGFLQVV